MKTARAVLTATALTVLLSHVPASAAVITFDTSTDLANNFDLDVIAGDSGTQWLRGYAAQSGFEGSDGGFVHFNLTNTGNSIGFKSGPVFLNSFDISSQYLAGGIGVPLAVAGGLDYQLTLFNSALSPVYSATLFVDATGDWTPVILNVADVYAIHIGPRTDSAGNGGWFPNLDNVTLNQPVATTPEPATMLLLGTGLLGAGVRRWRQGRG